MQGQLVAGRYRLADPIGRGGMGRVWRAHDEVLHRAVAIKELTAALYVSESDRTVLLARTRAEARAAARINHSAVVTVHDVLDHDGRPWIVMELVEGHSLADAVKEQGRVEPTEAARIGLWVLRALRAAHAAGVLHRDVKPGNVLLGRDGRVLLTDFGIAQVEGDTAITRTGEIVGSVDYLAPERIRGHDPGASSDLWALGATLYTAVEGRSPFRRTTPLTTMQAVVDEEPTEPQYAGPLGPVIAALLHKDPALRPDMAEAEQMLAEAAEGRRPSAAQAYVPTQHVGVESGSRDGTGPHTGAGTGLRTGAGVGGYGGTHRGPRGGVHGGAQGGAHRGGHSGAQGQAHGGARSGVGTPVTGTPYPPVTGATSVTPVGGPAHPAAVAAPAGPPGRRRLRTLALVVALAAIIGGGTAVWVQGWDEGRRQAADAGASALPSRTGAPTWVSVDDPAGFSLSLPRGWKRSVYSSEGGIEQIDYSPDGGEHFVRIAVDESPDFGDPYAHQLDLEEQLRRLVDYDRVRLERNVYRDRDGSLWEYTWTAQAKDAPPSPGPRRAIEETYRARDGVEYAIYMSSPIESWAKTRKQFTAVLQGWQPGTG
ncbi:serine/threonine-protein kinase [Streptomyces sp. AC555_RSS877]|uniref:serine/threonine-protein kinase n=1 Tax=Streptomyces sp. AC555_RSS877 TaxID=2823688 RepID=UPI001C2550EC|nr:serine/threonine-protein kinase [Streptomyces sp. AC555_RSS877]